MLGRGPAAFSAGAALAIGMAGTHRSEQTAALHIALANKGIFISSSKPKSRPASMRRAPEKYSAQPGAQCLKPPQPRLVRKKPNRFSFTQCDGNMRGLLRFRKPRLVF